MKSPCVATCKNKGGICSGCYRTIAEIRQWRDYNDQQREQIIQRLAGDDATHACPQCGKASYCGLSAGEPDCWCFSVETRAFEGPKQKQCLCRQCLTEHPLA